MGETEPQRAQAKAVQLSRKEVRGDANPKLQHVANTRTADPLCLDSCS